MSSGLILAGVALAGVGIAGRYLMRASQTFSQHLKHLPSAASFANSKYYKGGFEAQMSKREASLILGISPSANQQRLREAHRRIMLLNHPDRGGSPYLAAKINEAKDLLEKKTTSR